MTLPFARIIPCALHIAYAYPGGHLPFTIPYQQKIKRERSEHLISPDMVTKESQARSATDAKSVWNRAYELTGSYVAWEADG